MAPKMGILERSAITEKCKVSTACNEVLRRLKNRTQLLSKEIIELIMVDYANELISAGYSTPWIEKKFFSTLTGYERILLKEKQGLTERNRSGVGTFLHRRAKKLAGKYSWYEDKKKDRNPTMQTPVHKNGGRNKISQEKKIYETVIFVPLTRNASLKRRPTAMEENLGQPTKLRYVEDMGQTVAERIVCKDPWSGQGCGRNNCLPYKSTKGKCMRQGIVYTLDCLECKDSNVKSQYIGESARTGWDRGSNHVDSVDRRQEGHPIVDHYRQAIPNQKR